MASYHKQVAPILFGAGGIGQLYDMLQRMGVKKAVLCTDKGTVAAGVVDKVTVSLDSNGMPYAVFDECLPDAPEESFFGCADLIRSQGADAVVAVGGGSCLDTAKIASTLVDDPPADFDDLLKKMGPGPGGPPPLNAPNVKLILIPTTAGTGSEETGVGIISKSGTHEKVGILITGADLSIVDPELTVTLPPLLTATTGMDVIAHACEAYATKMMKNPFSDQRALAALRLAAEWLPTAVKDGTNIEARTNMSLACTLAGMAFNDTMCNIAHAIAHAFGTKSRMAHGHACALAEPPSLEAIAIDRPDLIRPIGEALGATIPEDATPEQVGKATGDALRSLMVETGVPSLAKLGYSREDVTGHLDAVMAEQQLFFSPIEVSPELIGGILGSMYDDYQ
jgi:alcohol dehydrogenase class IV